MNNYKKQSKRGIFCVSVALLGILHGQSSFAQDATSDDLDDDVFELSPFVIETDENVGYLATSTLAGTRLKTDLKDVGSAISVVTPEFLEDTGATDTETLLAYTLSTEIGGAVGNFAGAGAANGDEGSNSDARANPMNNNRVRGLSRAEATRDYFLTSFAFDSYNTENVTISRGPNSILFGIGEPGGIIENSLKKAVFGSEISRLTFRLGKNGTHREAIDVNREVLENRLALRFNAMNERVEFQQKPAYEEDKRWTLSAKLKLFRNENIDWMGATTVYANFEKAEIRGTPPSTTPPMDTYSTWWKAEASAEADVIFGIKQEEGYRENYPSKWIVDPLGDGQPEAKFKSSQPAMWNSYSVVYADRSGLPTANVGDLQVIHTQTSRLNVTLPNGQQVPAPGNYKLTSSSDSEWKSYPGFKNYSIQDSKIYDWQNLLLPGRMQYSNHDFEAYNVNLEQNFFNNKLGFQLVFDKQEHERDWHFPLGNANRMGIRIDTSAYLPNGAPNPNVGRPMLSGKVTPRNFNVDERETKRFTAYYNLDFSEKDGWSRYLGNHIFNGLLNNWVKKNRNGGYLTTWDDSHDPDQDVEYLINKKHGQFPMGVFYLAYVGDPQWDAETPNDLRLYQDYLRIKTPKPGDMFNNYYYNRYGEGSLHYSTIGIQEMISGLDAKRQEIDSTAFTWQGKFLKNHIIATWGWREDTSKSWDVDQNKFRNSSRVWDDFSAWKDGWVNDDGIGTFSEADPVLNESGRTKTTQVVAHVPDSWLNWAGGTVSSVSFHWAESENFNPASVRRDVWGDTIDHPSGETEEYGVALGLFKDKAYVKLNWYETTSMNISNKNFTSEWATRWPISLAQRWLTAKNGSFDKGGRPFEDYAWHGPSGPGKDNSGSTYQPERLGGFNSFDEVISAFLASVPEGSGHIVSRSGALGEEIIDFQSPEGLKNTYDAVSEGFEVELVYNITSSWRVAFNASKTKSVGSNSMPKIGPYIEQQTQSLIDMGLWGIADSPQEGGTTEERWTNEILVPYNAAKAKDGQASSELRKWRWSMITNYVVRDGALKGFGLGGSVRWQDKVSTGYPFLRDNLNNLIPDLANPYYGDSRWDGDMWFSYKTELMGYPVKFQLNMQNYLGDRDPIDVTHNPDGKLAIIRSAPEKRWFFTTTIDF